jgi:N-acyl-D-amino-acid deacylase
VTTSRRLLLRGGLVADGIGDVVRRADVLIDGAVIGWIRDPADGEEPGPGGDWEVIDLAPGSIVCPGFIDAHVHAEGPLLESGVVEGALAQGVTTLVVGQDGESWIGATTETARSLNRYFGPVNGSLEPARDLSVAGFRDAVAGRLVQNVAVLASQGTIRHNVVGLAPRPTGAAEAAEARRQVEVALADGAVGLSSGLDYVPSRLGTVEEIAAMCAPLVAAGRPYVSHTRGNGPTATAGLTELIAVGERAGVRVHASHLWGTPAELEVAFGAADAAGVGLSVDMYPYRKSSTILAVLLLPAEVQAEGPDGTLAALTDRRRRVEILADEKLSETFLQDIYLGRLPAEFARFAGMPVASAAASEGSRSAGEWVLDLLISAGLNVGAHLDRPTLTEADLDWLAAHERHCAGSDGIYQGQHPHPRGYGAFARLAEHYLAVGSDAGAQRLARHLAAKAADAYGLSDRGRLAAGMAADVSVIGPAGIDDHATYNDPRVHATGVDLVIVNGVVVKRGGQPGVDRLPGQFVI